MLSDEYHVYVVDQRNHGQSPHSNEFTYTDLVNDLRAFITGHHLAHPVLLGHSMGGKTVMHYALRYPEEVERLIVVDIAPRPYDVRHDGIVNALQSIPIDAITSRQEADAILSRYISEPGVRQFLLKNLMRKPQGGFGWRVNLPVIAQKLEAISAGLDVQGVFKNPTLFIRGALSDYILDEDRDLIKKYFPASTLVTLNTGHWVQAEKPEEFVSTVRQFLHAR